MAGTAGLLREVVGLATASSSSTTTTPTTLPDGAAGANSALGTIVLGAAVLVVLLGLGFAALYHWRLFGTIDKAIGAGQKVTTRSDSAYEVTAQSAGPTIAPEIGVAGPTKVTVGEKVTYKAVQFSDGNKVSWTVEGVDAEPTQGDGPELEVTFKAEGTAKVTAAEPGRQPQPLEVTVAGAAEVPEGIVLPFAIANWGRFVVVVLGLGVVAALMVWDVISVEAGMGPLGALLGVGAASAAQEKTAEPTTKKE